MLFTAVACGLFEVTGWGSRLHSHFHPDRLGPYLVQLVSTTPGIKPLSPLLQNLRHHQRSDPTDCCLFRDYGGDHQTRWAMLQSLEARTLCVPF